MESTSANANRSEISTRKCPKSRLLTRGLAASSSAFNLLVADLNLYLNTKTSTLSKQLKLIILLVCTNRDFRLNCLVRLNSTRLPIISSVANTILFYAYGCTISSRAELRVPIRFSHGRNITIGGEVSFEPPGLAYIFNNVTLGKRYPLSTDVPLMPKFKGRVFFGVNSVVLGSVCTSGDTVFAANSSCINLAIPANSTVVSHNVIHQGTFMDDISYPFLPTRCCVSPLDHQSSSLSRC